MGTSLDAAGISSSLTQRRSAAAHLPAFELPPPSHFPPPQLQYKFPPLSSLNVQAHPASVGNLLTPPPNSGSDSGHNSANIPPHTMPVLPYTPQTFWQGAGASAATYASLTPQPWQHNPLLGKPMYSPAGAQHRSDLHSPVSGTGSSLPPPPFDLSAIQPYPQPVTLASPGSSVGQAAHHPGSLGSSILSHQVRTPSQTSQLSPIDVSRATSTPSLYTAMTATATPQPPYGFQSSTPVSQSPHTAHPSSSTTSPPLHHGPIPQLQTSPFIKPPYPSYTLPAMPGPVMTNLNNPNAQMAMVGNIHSHMLPMHFNSGFAANPQMAYAQARANSPQQSQNQDRPFKCDECPQSFNRNHDLKRHKRIHLAVKPFPCSHCDKSFSRKDALKVRIFYQI